MSGKLRVAMIGVGGIAGTHYKSWSEIADQAEIVAVCDVSGEQVAKRGEEWNVEKRFTDFGEMLRTVECDAVDVCTPNKAHTPAVIAALEAGRDVLCEKPLAATPAEIQQMIAARDKSGRLLMTAQHMRFEGKSLALKQAIDTGELGDVYYARSWFLRRRRLPARPGFYVKELSGGGPCIDIGVHTLDLTLHFLGFPRPVSVSGVTPCKLAKKPGISNEWGHWGGAWQDKYDVEDFAAGMVRFENGLALTLEVSWMLNQQPSEQFSISLFGDRAGAFYPDLKIVGEQPGGPIYEKTLLAPGSVEGHKNEIRHFVDAVVNGKPSPVPAEESLIVQQILDGLYRSSASNAEVRIG